MERKCLAPGWCARRTGVMFNVQGHRGQDPLFALNAAAVVGLDGIV